MENRKKAYAFFDSSASIKQIKGGLGNVRKYVRVPEGLELRAYSVTEFRNNPESPKKLLDLMNKSKVYPIIPISQRDEVIKAKPVKDLKYFIEAEQKDTQNEVVARSLGDILSGIYAHYDEGKSFIAIVVYDRNGEYEKLEE